MYIALFVALFVTSHFVSVAHSQDDANITCPACVIGSSWSDGTIWYHLHDFLNETAYIEVDESNDSSTTLSIVPNEDASASFSAACTSAIQVIASLNGNLGGGGSGSIQDCIKDGLFIQRGSGSGSDRTMIYPTDYLSMASVVTTRYQVVSASGSQSCSALAREISQEIFYAIQDQDSDWTSTPIITFQTWPPNPYLHRMPYSAFSSISDWSTCSPGGLNGIPTTKIAVSGIASTVYQYKSGPPSSATRSPAAPASSGSGVVAPTPAPPKPPNHPGPPNNPNNPSGPRNPSPPIVTPPPEATNLLPSGGGFVLPNGGTLRPGSETTISGTRFSLTTDRNGAVVVIGSSTIPLEPSGVKLPPGFSMLVSSAGIVLPNGKTLRPGMETTVSGTVVSIDGDGNQIVIGSSTVSGITRGTDVGVKTGNEYTGEAAPGGMKGPNRLWSIGFGLVVYFAYNCI